MQGSIEESEGSWLYLLLARIADVLVGLEQRADVDSLSAPHRPVDGPVEGQLQGAPIQRAIYRGQRHHGSRGGFHSQGGRHDGLSRVQQRERIEKGR